MQLPADGLQGGAQPAGGMAPYEPADVNFVVVTGCVAGAPRMRVVGREGGSVTTVNLLMPQKRKGNVARLLVSVQSADTAASLSILVSGNCIACHLSAFDFKGRSDHQVFDSFFNALVYSSALHKLTLHVLRNMQVEFSDDIGRQALAALGPGTIVTVTGALEVVKFNDKATGQQKEFIKLDADGFTVRRPISLGFARCLLPCCSSDCMYSKWLSHMRRDSDIAAQHNDGSYDLCCTP